MQTINFAQKKKHWYAKWWGIVLLVFLFLTIVLAGMTAYQVKKMMKDIQSGVFIPPEVMDKKAPYDMKLLVDELIPWTGRADAKVQIVEFGDFKCSNTQHAFPILRELSTEYQDKVKFYWRSFPILGEESLQLSLASICAQRQDKFWQFHDKLFPLAATATVADASDIALSIGLNMPAFNACLTSELTKASLRKDIYTAQDGQVIGTPTFFINGFKITGTPSKAKWKEIIDKFINIYDK